MNSTCCIINHKGFVRSHGLLKFNPFNSLIGHVGGKVIIRIILFNYTVICRIYGIGLLIKSE